MEACQDTPHPLFHSYEHPFENIWSLADIPVLAKERSTWAGHEVWQFARVYSKSVPLPLWLKAQAGHSGDLPQ